MAREIHATVEFVGQPGKAEINAFARSIVPLPSPLLKRI